MDLESDVEAMHEATSLLEKQSEDTEQELATHKETVRELEQNIVELETQLARDTITFNLEKFELLEKLSFSEVTPVGDGLVLDFY